MLVLWFPVTFRWLRARVEKHRRDIDAAGEDEVEGAPQDRGTARLGNEATRALVEHLAHVADRLGPRDDDQGRVRLERPHGAEPLEAGPARHARVHQDGVVAPSVAALVNHPVEGPRLTKAHPVPEGLQQEPQAGPEQLIAISDQYFHRRT